jgi:hypothetical protein
LLPKNSKKQDIWTDKGTKQTFLQKKSADDGILEKIVIYLPPDKQNQPGGTSESGGQRRGGHHLRLL